MPRIPTGTDTRKTRCHSTGASRATQDEPDEGARDGHRVVDAEPEPALVGREGVRDDGRGVGEEHGATDALADPHRRSATMAPAVPWSQVTARRMEKTVKTAKPRLKIFTRPNMSPTRPSDTTQHGQHDHEAQEHPEQVAGVARGQWVEADTPEDVGERNQDDRLVDEDHQRAQGDRGQGDPAVIRRFGRRRPRARPLAAERAAAHRFNVNVRVRGTGRRGPLHSRRRVTLDGAGVPLRTPRHVLG